MLSHERNKSSVQLKGLKKNFLIRLSNRYLTALLVVVLLMSCSHLVLNKLLSLSYFWPSVSLILYRKM